MIETVIPNYQNPMNDIKLELGEDLPLYQYIIKAIQDIEVLDILPMYKIDDSVVCPFIHVCNWRWNPHPSSDEIQYRRRETGLKMITKYIGNTRIGILEFDILCGARDKNKRLETKVIHNKMYVPIADEKGRYLLDNVLYPEYQLVDKLLYPSGKNVMTLKSLLPIVISYNEGTAESMDGYIIDAKVGTNAQIGSVKIFTSMEPIISCFMHLPDPLAYLGVFPILQFSDHICEEEKAEYEYFKPLDDVDDIYIKAYREGLDTFEYVRSVLIMFIALIRKCHPDNYECLREPRWWIHELSYYENIIEHRGACHQMHVARMLDTISAEVLPIPENDKTNMHALLRYVLQTDFDDVDIYSYENKRFRKNEVISTIVTADISDKLKRMYKFGSLLKMKDMESILKFNSQIILNKMNSALDGIVHVCDFANDCDYVHFNKFSKKGPNSLGRHDKHRIGFSQRQLHPSMLGVIDLLESSKDVGQNGMISPWADLSLINDTNPNKYPNIKFELYRFIEDRFIPALRFNARNIVEYNHILDLMVLHSPLYFNIEYFVEGEEPEEVDT